MFLHDSHIHDQVKYIYHVQGPYGQGAEDLSDPLIMSFFLAIPLASLLWAVLCFGITMTAYGVQGASQPRTILLSALIGLLSIFGGLAVISLRNVRRPCAAALRPGHRGA